jgi:hypothetical protein
MPRPRKNLDEFRAEIELRVTNGQTQKEICSYLATEGLRVSRNTLSARCVAWEAIRYSKTSVSEPALVSAVETAFHTTHHNDETIARNITTQGIPTTQSQVKKVRLAHGWRRRANNDDQLATTRAETFTLAFIGTDFPRSEMHAHEVHSHEIHAP